MSLFTCRHCHAHFNTLYLNSNVLVAAMAFALIAPRCELSPWDAIEGYFDSFHEAGHPADAPVPGVNPVNLLQVLYEDMQEDARLTVNVSEAVRNGKRMESHPFEMFADDDVDSYCGHGMQDGDFCGHTPANFIHSYLCSGCGQRGWAWANGVPHCGFCKAEEAP